MFVENWNINVDIGSHSLPYIWWSWCGLVLVVSNSASAYLGLAVLITAYQGLIQMGMSVQGTAAHAYFEGFTWHSNL